MAESRWAIVVKSLPGQRMCRHGCAIFAELIIGLWSSGYFQTPFIFSTHYCWWLMGYINALMLYVKRCLPCIYQSCCAAKLRGFVEKQWHRWQGELHLSFNNKCNDENCRDLTTCGAEVIWQTIKMKEPVGCYSIREGEEDDLLSAKVCFFPFGLAKGGTPKSLLISLLQFLVFHLWTMQGLKNIIFITRETVAWQP